MAAAEKRYLFLVDDEPIQNEMLKDYLSERFLFDLKVFESGEEALQNIGLNPEIVILDYHLSGKNRDAKNGLQVLQDVKEKKPRHTGGNAFRARQTGSSGGKHAPRRIRLCGERRNGFQPH